MPTDRFWRALAIRFCGLRIQFRLSGRREHFNQTRNRGRDLIFEAALDGLAACIDALDVARVTRSRYTGASRSQRFETCSGYPH